MIIFHEGLPRSGKTYEAVVRHVLKALREKRRVVAYIEGLNHAYIAQVLEMPEAEIRRLLRVIPRDEVLNILDWVEDNALIVVDEVQNFWPMEYREKLNPKLMQLIAEHGRRGMDILLMGQCFADVHATWRRRTSMRVEFMKREVIGSPDEYTWRMYKATAPEKFAHVSTGKGRYEEKYFPCYKSYDVEAPENTAYADERANLWNHKGLRYGIPAMLVGLAVVGYYLVGFFGGDVELVPEEAKTVVMRHDIAPGQRVLVSGPQEAPEVVPPKPPIVERPKDFLSELANASRPRLAGIIQMNGEHRGIVEFYQQGDRVHERFTFEALQAFGYEVEPKPYGVDLVKGETRIHVTQWPLLDQAYRVSEARIDQVRELGRTADGVRETGG